MGVVGGVENDVGGADSFGEEVGGGGVERREAIGGEARARAGVMAGLELDWASLGVAWVLPTPSGTKAWITLTKDDIWFAGGSPFLLLVSVGSWSAGDSPFLLLGSLDDIWYSGDSPFLLLESL